MFKKICLIGVALASVGCQSTHLSRQAQQVILSPNAPSPACQYISSITGNQGNFVSGAVTSNKNLEQGAMNDLRNKAANLGANYVQMLGNRSGVTGHNGGQRQTNVIYTGNAYKCPR